MARGRMIANTVATDKKLNALSSEAALVYLMAIPHLDRDGLILGDAMPLWGKVCPRRTEFMTTMQDIIAEWVNVCLVLPYECDEGMVLYFKGFGKNQTGIRYDREAPSVFPTPPGYIRTGNGLEKACDGVSPELVRSESRPNPPQSKVKQSKTNESKPGADDGWRSIVDTYQREIGVVTQSIGEEMRVYHDEVGAPMLIDAIKEASRNNVRKWSYVDGILKRWKVNGRSAPRDSALAWADYGSGIPDYTNEA